MVVREVEQRPCVLRSLRSEAHLCIVAPALGHCGGRAGTMCLLEPFPRARSQLVAVLGLQPSSLYSEIPTMSGFCPASRGTSMAAGLRREGDIQ